jgi:23S rRNA (uracil1939-C5)-methyltransferase
MSARFTIARLGAQGDGVAEAEGGQVFVPFALPGETVTAARNGQHGELMAVLEASPQRVDPACRHFGECGGCVIQHLEESAYRAWKRDKVAQALASRQIATEAADLVPCAPETRRRVTLSARRTEKSMLLGYNRASSHSIVDIEECPIAVPAIVAALDVLRALADRICATKDVFRLTVTATETGLDVAAQASGRLDDGRRRAAADFAMRGGFARLSIDGEVIIEPRRPKVSFDGVAVEPPPGAFLQATAEAEAAMAGLVTAHLARARHVADLFAGCGTFALRLAKGAQVHAVEGDAASLAALDRAFRFGAGLKRVTAERRDLFRRPLIAGELQKFDGLVFDPPRAGAEDQCRQIAKSDIPLVAAVSCNPGTLARDLAILVAGGYRVKSVTPIDQFLWSAHVEAVALLEKPRRRR